MQALNMCENDENSEEEEEKQSPPKWKKPSTKSIY